MAWFKTKGIQEGHPHLLKDLHKDLQLIKIISNKSKRGEESALQRKRKLKFCLTLSV